MYQQYETGGVSDDIYWWKFIAIRVGERRRIRHELEQGTSSMRIAVIGSGIAGISSAWALSANNHVTLYESSDRFGGHSRTIDVETESSDVAVDTGFIVYNEPNYPNLTAFFDVLGVDTYDSEMSFAVSTDDRQLEYAGRASGMFPSLGSFAEMRRWNIVRGIRQFRSEQTMLENGSIPADITVGDYLTARLYPSDFLDLYLLPLASAVWSGTRNNVANMPAKTFLTFLDNHGLLSLRRRPQWRTVSGGSRSYVDRAVKEITAAHTGRAVAQVVRADSGILVTDRLGVTESYDHVVFATHADVALAILGSGATEAETGYLSAFDYDRNEVVLHTDASAMPSNRRVWSAWNAVQRGEDDGSTPVSVSYWMNRLQSLDTTTDLFVTLNPGGSLDDARVLDRWITSHPQFSIQSEAAQKEIAGIQGLNNTWFAGAHLGHGFHEDGIRSGVAVAAALGSPPPWASANDQAFASSRP
jgi:predicted NAD/FAD-binding protein